MAANQPLPKIDMPQIFLIKEDALDSALPLEHTVVTGQVTGPVAVVAVTQRFGNPIQSPAELEYLFPLPEDAAITGFELRIGDRSITGDMQESGAAQQTYQEAREAGQRVGLFEQRRPNLYAVRLANVQPGEVIHSTVRYQQRLKVEDGVYEFVFPMGITPKFDSPAHPGEGAGVHAPYSAAGAAVGPVEISLAVDAGIAVHEITSPSHLLDLVQMDERRFQVRLSGEHIPDRDFVLRYTAAGSQIQAVAWASGEPGKEYFLATLLPPGLEDDPQPYPREFIFVLDRSGSMSGLPIAQARNSLRACLRSLNPEDTFRILLFDNYVEWFKNEPAKVTQEEIDGADAYLKAVEGRGGTEIVEALETALDCPPDPARARFVIFLTDGAVSAEARALDQIRQKIGAARLFTFGIGPSVNRALLNRMAALGRGRASFLQLEEDIEGAIIRFQDSVSFPVASGLSLTCPTGNLWDIYPFRLPDLYAGQPLEICGRLARAYQDPVELVLRGDRGGRPFEVRVTVPTPAGQEPAVGRLWAQARITDLLDRQALEPNLSEQTRAEVVSLAQEFNLLTAYTSFIAVDSAATAGGQAAQTIRVAHPVPQNLVFYPAPAAPPSMPVSQPGIRSMQAPPARMSILPAFLRPEKKSTLAADSMTTGAVQARPEDEKPDLPGTGQRETALRWLARTQNLDGSWGSSLERTATALLAFIRAGHTTRSGSFRQIVRRAMRWLVENPQPGSDNFLRARALEEMAKATQSDADRAAAQAAQLILNHPSSDLEQAALGQPVSAPGSIQSLDDLRLAGLLQLDLEVPESLRRGSEAELVATWAATLPFPD